MNTNADTERLCKVVPFPDAPLPKMVRKEPETVGEYLDSQIELARKRVETLCIHKAKAEASGLLNFPHDQVCAIVLASAYL